MVRSCVERLLVCSFGRCRGRAGVSGPSRVLSSMWVCTPLALGPRGFLGKSGLCRGTRRGSVMRDA